MKNLITSLIFLFIATYAYSDCTSKGICVYPSGETIPQNGAVIIEGYFFSEPHIDSLDGTYKAYLTSKGHSVKMKLKGIYPGGFRLTQAVLVPTEPLIVGKTYHLYVEIDQGKSLMGLTKWNLETLRSGPPMWRVIEGAETENLTMESKAMLVGAEVVHYGCGPSEYTYFQMPKAEGKSDYWVKTELIDLTTGEATVYHLTHENGRVEVGHGMCSGGFKYPSEGKYEVRFKWMDISGRESKHWSTPVTFDRPT